MKPKTSALHILSAVIASLLITLVLLWTVFNNSHWSKPRPQRPDFSSALEKLGTPIALKTNDFTVLSTNSLFEINRKAPPPEPPKEKDKAPPKAPPEDRLDKVTILGIYGVAPNGGVIIRIDDKEQRLRLNENIDDWKLQSIDGRTIKFKSEKGNEREMILEHKIPESASSTAQAPKKPQAAQQNRK